MIVSVINTYHWTPDYVMNMCLDSFDFMGIEFWYTEIQNEHKKINKAKP